MTQTAKLTASTDLTASAHFGYAVAISGNTVVVGAYEATVGGNRLQGAAYVFVQSGSAWPQSQELLASDGAANKMFGYSVAIDGSSIVVGLGAYVFQSSATLSPAAILGGTAIANSSGTSAGNTAIANPVLATTANGGLQKLPLAAAYLPYESQSQPQQSDNKRSLAIRAIDLALLEYAV
jgi:hypothetical protein